MAQKQQKLKPKISLSSIPEFDAVTHLERAIKEFGAKWHFREDGVVLIQKSCVSKQCGVAEEFKALFYLIWACLCLGFVPFFLGYLSIFANNRFDLQASLESTLSKEPCAVKSNELLSLPPNDCASLCQGLDEIPTYDAAEMTRKEFSALYAYTGRPVVIRGAARDWKATRLFNFAFLKDLFEPYLGELNRLHLASLERDLDQELSGETWDYFNNCQFLPDYVLESDPKKILEDFVSVFEFFNMSEARSRADPSEKSYYARFNNCFYHEINLRQFYPKLKFLPADSELKRFDWFRLAGIPSGNPSRGAPVRIDDGVGKPSWYAVLSGEYSWKMIPPLECQSVCKPILEAHIRKGDVFVVDDSTWSYTTRAKEGMTTVVFGTQYD